MKLFCVPGACSLADHIVLEWIGAPYEISVADAVLRASSEYRALNPAGAVPVLVDGDWALTQNVAILTYLADRAPEANLMGDGSLRNRAEVMRWLAFCNSDIHPQFGALFHGTTYLESAEASERAKFHAREVLAGHFKRANAQLATHTWIAGKTRSVTDAYLYVVTRWAKNSAVQIADLSHLLAFARRMEADVAVIKVLAEEGLEPAFANTELAQTRTTAMAPL